MCVNVLTAEVKRSVWLFVSNTSCTADLAHKHKVLSTLLAIDED